MKLNRKWLMVIALVMSLTMVTAGTLAYLTDRDTEVNVFTMGDVDIELDEKFEQDSELIPGVDIEKEAIIKNVGKNDAWVWLSVLLPYEMGPHTAPDNMSASNNVVHWNYPGENGSKMTIKFNSTPVEVDTDGDGAAEKYYTTVMLWNEILEAGDATDIMMNKVYMDKHVDITPEGDLYWVEGGETTDLNWNINDNGNPKIIVSAYAIQTEGFETAEEAYKAYTEQWGGLNLGTLEDDSNHICWNGTSDTSWYNDTDTEFVLTTPEQLAGLAELVDGGNTFAGKTIKLGNDICLECYDENGERVTFNPIGNNSVQVFEGTFDGQNHTIENLYQSGWALGYEWETYGSVSLFSTLNNATVKNLTMSGSTTEVEGGDVAGIAGSATGTCVFENITIEASNIATYNNACAGIVGWSGAGSYTFKDITIEDDVELTGLWGSFDSSVGGIVGQAEPGATYDFEDVEINCRLNVFNDCTASYDYYNYRMCGMVMGRLEETTTIDGTNYPDISKYNITCNDVTVNYGDWMNYHYCDPTPGYNNGRGMRVEPGYSYDGLPADYDHSQCTTHHNELIPFDQIFGGAQYAVKGLKSYTGVTVNYPD